MDFLRELDLDEPIEVGLSAESLGGRSRLLKICHRDSRIYIAGMTQFPEASSEEPEPDAFSKLEEECIFLRDRIAELELRSGGMV